MHLLEPLVHLGHLVVLPLYYMSRGEIFSNPSLHILALRPLELVTCFFSLGEHLISHGGGDRVLTRALGIVTAVGTHGAVWPAPGRV